MTPRILIADDESYMRNLYKDIVGLHSTQTKVDEVESAEALIILASQKPYSLIITDNSMSGIQGYEAIKTLRETQNPNQNTPIYLISGDSDKIHQKALENGATGTIKKTGSILKPLTSVLEEHLSE